MSGLQGSKIAAVEFRGMRVDPPVLANLQQLVAQTSGDRLDREKVGQSLRALYATGRFADVQVAAEKTQDNQVRLVFTATENLFIGLVAVEGAPKRPTQTQLVDASKLALGELFAEDKLERALELMKTTLADNGYFKATVTADKQVHPRRQQIEIIFHVNPGPVARVGNVTLEGDALMNAGDVREIAKMHPGDKVSIQKQTSALQRLRKKFTKQDRLEAQISIVAKNYHADSNTLDYGFRIVRGPRVDVRVEGASLSKKNIQRYVPVYEEHAVDEDLLNEGRRNIRDYLQTQGFFDATVDYSRRPQPQQNRTDIVYQVERGERHDLVGVFVDGNKYFDTPLIRERMSVQPASWLTRHGRFSQELLNHDTQIIRDLYLANGFLQAKVTGTFQDDFRGKKGDMAVFIHVEEGPQTLVSSLKLEGNKAIPDERLLGLLTTIEGQPYSEVNVITDRDTLLNFYFNNGFPDASFSAKAMPAANDANKMAVVFTISEGPQVFTDRILMTGLQFTKTGIVRRQFAIRANDPLSQVGMLETQRKLYDLGVFNAVDIAVQNPEGKAHFKDIFFQFEEAKRWTFTYGFGIEIQTGSPGAATNPQGQTSVSPRVSLDVTRINVGGRAHTLTFKSHVGRLQQRGLVSYDAPRFLRNENLRLTLSAFYDNSVDVRTFTSERLEGSAQIEHVISRTSNNAPVTSLLYRFTYRRVRAADVVVNAALIPLYSRPVRVGMPSLTYIRDRRDDPIETHHGSYNTFDTGVASGVFGSEAAFGRFNGQNTTYHEFHQKRWVFARNIRLGVAAPFGQTKLLPLPERFFAGGSSSHRGFGINQAGPRDTTTGLPLGGNAVFVNNLELRTPPVLLPFVGDNLSFALFHDMGNVFNNANDMLHSLVRWSQPHKEYCKAEATKAQCSFDYVSHAIGLGVRYRTPVGPIRIDLGYNLNPPVFPVGPDPKNNVPFHSETLHHFNFSFSIGQTF